MTMTTAAADTAAVPADETSKRARKPGTTPGGVDPVLVGRMVTQAREQGLQLSGEGGLLQQLTKIVLESALEGEITDHLGYDKHDPAGANSGNSRNGARAKTVLTDVGPVEVTVPRDRAAGPAGQLRADHRAQAAAPAVRCGGPGAVAVGQGPDHRRDQRAPGRGVRR
jgi:putative transposase